MAFATQPASTLANKYRPRSVSEFHGQEHVTSVISTMLRRWDNDEIILPPGLILAGPRGGGKTSMARVIAAALNCHHETNSAIPCGECPPCLSIFSQTAPFVMELDGATNGLVDDVRNLKTVARLTHGGDYRVFIVDECHAMSREAFSALLKQLEEPPPDVLYILVTTDYNQLPPTIVSRCLSFMYSAIESADIETRLAEVCRRERFIYEPEALAHIARKARGAMRDALMMLQHLAIVEDITLARATALWPDDLKAFAATFMMTALAGDAISGMTAIHQTFLVHRNAYEMVDSIITQLRDAIQRPEDNPALAPLSVRVVAELMRHAWDLRIRLRSAPASDKTLVEALWFVIVREMGTAPTTTKRVQVVNQAEVHTNGRTPEPAANILSLLENI